MERRRVAVVVWGEGGGSSAHAHLSRCLLLHPSRSVFSHLRVALPAIVKVGLQRFIGRERQAGRQVPHEQPRKKEKCTIRNVHTYVANNGTEFSGR